MDPPKANQVRGAGVLLVLTIVCAAAEARDGIWRGNFVAGRQGLMMSPCRSGERLRVEDRTPGRELESLYREVTQRPGRAVFVELQGKRDGSRLIAERFVRAGAEGPGCREDLASVRLRAQGTDPVWQLDARAGAVLLRWRGGREPERFPAQAFRKLGETFVYEGAARHSVLRVTVREERCRDPMLGAVYTLRAIAQWDGRKYSGCAYWGDLGSE
jgi:uncharacterized membrane protein